MIIGKNLNLYLLNENVFVTVSESPSAIIVNFPDSSQPKPPANVKLANCPSLFTFNFSDQTHSSSGFLITKLT